MRSILENKKGQLTLGDAPSVVLIVGFVFLVMATMAFISTKYGDALTDGSVAQNVTNDLNTEIANNTSIAGIVLTISLVNIPALFGSNIRKRELEYRSKSSRGQDQGVTLQYARTTDKRFPVYGNEIQSEHIL